MSFIDSHPTRVVIRALSIRVAKRCRELIQGGFREEEWADIDREFYSIVRASLVEFADGLARKRDDEQAAVRAAREGE